MSTIQNARCRVRATAKALLKGYRETGACYFFCCSKNNIYFRGIENVYSRESLLGKADGIISLLQL